MTTQFNNLPFGAINRAGLIKAMLIGGGTGLVLMIIFLSGTGAPNPAWGKFWMLRPLILEPLAGTAGAVFAYFMTKIFAAGWKKFLATFIGIFGFVVALWLGSVLGLAGTYWH